jgi:hypothetical protein
MLAAGKHMIRSVHTFSKAVLTDIGRSWEVKIFTDKPIRMAFCTVIVRAIKTGNDIFPAASFADRAGSPA